MKKIFLIFSIMGNLVFPFSMAALAAQENVIDLSHLKGFANIENTKPIKEGQKALVYFWAEWCPDCKQKIKGDLKDLHDKGVQVFTVNKDKRKSKAGRFLKKFDVKLPVYLDESKKISLALKAFSVPHWAVIQNKENKNNKKIWVVLTSGSGNFKPALSYLGNL